MPRHDKHETTTRMYKGWRDARPTVPVPFKYKAKGEGNIVQTWGDIKDKMNRDATSYALAFCTAHLAPSTAQANVLHELSVRDERLSKRNRQSEAERESKRRVRDNGGGDADALPSAAQPASELLAPRRVFLSPVEQAALQQSEGGGRGRVAFLKERNKLPLNVRYGLMARTSQQQYGWALLNNDHRDELVEHCRHVQYATAAAANATAAASPSAGGGGGLGVFSSSTTTTLPPLAGATTTTRQPFVSEFVSAEVARRSQIPPEYASLGARPNNTVPFALSVVANVGNNAAFDRLASESVAVEPRQSDSHRHARGDFRKRTFNAGMSRATGVFPTSEFC